MRRALLALAVMVAFAMLTASQASAAAVVNRAHFSGGGASATWNTDQSNTWISVTTSHHGGPVLILDQWRIFYDSRGNVTGYSDIWADEVTSGFSFSADSALTRARLNGTSIPVKYCQYDENVDQTSCTDATVAASVVWTGQGPVSGYTQGNHYASPEYKFASHERGAGRAAIVEGTVDGLSRTSDTPNGWLYRIGTGWVDITIGSGG